MCAMCAMCAMCVWLFDPSAIPVLGVSCVVCGASCFVSVNPPEANQGIHPPSAWLPSQVVEASKTGTPAHGSPQKAAGNSPNETEDAGRPTKAGGWLARWGCAVGKPGALRSEKPAGRIAASAAFRVVRLGGHPTHRPRVERVPWLLLGREARHQHDHLPARPSPFVWFWVGFFFSFLFSFLWLLCVCSTSTPPYHTYPSCTLARSHHRLASAPKSSRCPPPPWLAPSRPRPSGASRPPSTPANSTAPREAENPANPTRWRRTNPMARPMASLPLRARARGRLPLSRRRTRVL